MSQFFHMKISSPRPVMVLSPTIKPGKSTTHAPYVATSETLYEIMYNRLGKKGWRQKQLAKAMKKRQKALDKVASIMAKGGISQGAAAAAIEDGEVDADDDAEDEDNDGDSDDSGYSTASHTVKSDCFGNTYKYGDVGYKK